MAKSAVTLALNKCGPNRINKKGGEEDTILSGYNCEQMQDLDARIAEQPRKARTAELDRLKHRSSKNGEEITRTNLYKRGK